MSLLSEYKSKFGIACDSGRPGIVRFFLLLQRFENGVIYCRSDGGNDVIWLSWHDWHAISHPKDVNDKHP